MKTRGPQFKDTPIILEGEGDRENTFKYFPFGFYPLWYQLTTTTTRHQINKKIII